MSLMALIAASTLGSDVAADAAGLLDVAANRGAPPPKEDAGGGRRLWRKKAVVQTSGYVQEAKQLTRCNPGSPLQISSNAKKN